MCIPRDAMPQVDNADLAELIVYLTDKCGVGVSLRSLPTGWLKIQQCDTVFDPDRLRSPARVAMLLQKPLLVSLDLTVVDGNHRLLLHRFHGTPEVPCYQIGCSFEKSREYIAAFPRAYRFGDGPQPERS